MFIDNKNTLYTFHHLPQKEQPDKLFFKGDTSILSLPSISIVGSRFATPTGYQIAKRLAQALAGQGIVITSGLATGIDQAAHEGALAAKGKTIAILPNALSERDFYKGRNIDLSRQIFANGGLLLSEYESGTTYGNRFTERDRLIAGHSVATVAVECRWPKAGTRATVRMTVQYGGLVWFPKIPQEMENHENYEGIKAMMSLYNKRGGFDIDNQEHIDIMVKIIFERHNKRLKS